MSAGAAGAQGLARNALLARLEEPRTWDVLVIGGGATGLGCAVDAAARGYSTLLLEAHDFAKGTSSRATKLIHGGVRYLAQGNLPLVREALAERALLLANAPHLVHAQRFVVPAYRIWDQPVLGAGLAAYDLLAGAHGIGRARVLDAARTLAALPNVRPRGLRGGVAYWDARFDDARLAVSLMRTLFDLGGLALNHMPVKGLVMQAGKVAGVQAQDGERGTAYRVAARVVINATGVWADEARHWERPFAPVLLRPSQGVHLVVGRDYLPGEDALLVPRTEDGRVLFAIPWQGRVLLGTTDTARPDAPLEPRPLEGEVDFILRTAARYLARAPTRAEVSSVFVGLRPLVGAGNASPTRGLSREHLIEVSPGGLVSIVGGKWTTYRRMGADAVDSARSVARLPARASDTAALRLHGAAQGEDPYGSDREQVEALPGAGRAIWAGLTLSEAEVRYAARWELARTVEDVLARRHRALFIDAALAAAAAPRVAAILAEELGRDAGWAQGQVAAFRALAAGYLPGSPRGS
ncbi:glycerol-3-phosphate dehydrogenase/oxidase [Pseudothauera nasutitermitis]|uniref:Glycerol-3-phosphate dehydrogenase/oxidase n=1 Tax=Pseudothauera nasutitermitis TaxID=2565930 RepID=A0A4S4ARL1_9RHOO|nr:glycerol-3-phosphate dehydrogenase/oxidase [Pseudothauera nasutitermitis]THF62412.1 glycerol-3-phosphate dehydrogenase/oxidase [Pseudothauera nasutitermitis]